MLNYNELHDLAANEDDDVVLEDERDGAQDQDLELEAEEELTQEKFRKLRKRLEICDTEKKAALEDAARTRADFLNSKRRLEEQFKSDRERIVDRVVEDFLPLIDSFETALLHGDEGGEEWKKGLRAMHGQFLGILRSYNIEEIGGEGQPFDPHEHDAVGQRPGDAPDTVLQVLQKGYKRGSTIIRPARVIIAA